MLIIACTTGKDPNWWPLLSRESVRSAALGTSLLSTAVATWFVPLVIIMGLAMGATDENGEEKRE